MDMNRKIAVEVPYSVIEDCVDAGIEDPADVVWYKTELLGMPDGETEWPGICKCKHQTYVLMDRIDFGADGAYYLGQCPWCNAVLWHKA